MCRKIFYRKADMIGTEFVSSSDINGKKVSYIGDY